MRRRFVLSAPASADLEEVLTYVCETSNRHRAGLVAERLYEAFHKLANNPGLGHKRDDLTDLPVLFYAVWSWLIVYRPDRQPLEVARVIHGARDVEAILRSELPWRSCVVMHSDLEAARSRSVRARVRATA